MVALLSSSPSLLLAAAGSDFSDDLVAVLFLAALALGVSLVLALRVGAARDSQPPSRGKAVARERSLAKRERRGVPQSRRRVISLYSTTPGQSPHEYNIGDTRGTRGSALVRAA
ncbi:MAG TPA: hypothetical protein VGJ91_07490 [Polyangiaceae bacterium]|jgi:hypothetical protein